MSKTIFWFDRQGHGISTCANCVDKALNDPALVYLGTERGEAYQDELVLCDLCSEVLSACEIEEEALY